MATVRVDLGLTLHVGDNSYIKVGLGAEDGFVMPGEREKSPKSDEWFEAMGLAVDDVYEVAEVNMLEKITEFFQTLEEAGLLNGK